MLQDVLSAVGITSMVLAVVVAGFFSTNDPLVIPLFITSAISLSLAFVFRK